MGTYALDEAKRKAEEARHALASYCDGLTDDDFWSALDAVLATDHAVMVAGQPPLTMTTEKEAWCFALLDPRIDQQDTVRYQYLKRELDATRAALAARGAELAEVLERGRLCHICGEPRSGVALPFCSAGHEVDGQLRAALARTEEAERALQEERDARVTMSSKAFVAMASAGARVAALKTQLGRLREAADALVDALDVLGTPPRGTASDWARRDGALNAVRAALAEPTLVQPPVGYAAPSVEGLALRNVRALAIKLQKTDPESARHLLRFCEEAGVTGDIMRAEPHPAPCPANPHASLPGECTCPQDGEP